jgi:UPF0288 family protein (methanogenesis marker protein 3)
MPSDISIAIIHRRTRKVKSYIEMFAIFMAKFSMEMELSLGMTEKTFAISARALLLDEAAMDL